MAKSLFGESESRLRVMQQIFATGSQVARWSVKLNDVSQVSWFMCCQDFEMCNGNLELNSILDRQPVKFRCYILRGVPILSRHVPWRFALVAIY